MGKTYIDTVKYLIYSNVEIKGLVEKPDIVGAIFGQTEGLLGDELDLRELQKNGRIGRIEVDTTPGKSGVTNAIIKIPSSLDMVETCIIAAALETVDRVGPCEAKIHIERVEDTRNMKRKTVVERAKYLLKNLLNTEIPESKEISESVRDEVKIAEITTYGADKLPAGPNIDKSNEIIIVEGRADVINLLKNDITHAIAVQGARVPKTILELTKKKETTIFLDGDRGGEIILNELTTAGAEIDFICRAPRGTEVEELSRKELIKCLRNKIPYEQTNGKKVDVVKNDVKSSAPYESPKINVTVQDRRAPEPFKKPEPVVVKKVERKNLESELNDLNNTLKARLYDENYSIISEIKVRDVIKSLEERNDVKAIVFDGIVTQRLVDLANNKGVKTILGIKLGNVNKKPDGIEIKTREN